MQEQLDKYGATTPEEVVTAAIAAGLDAIAITDHNTTAWCEQVQRAAEGRRLVVLPGVEISTKDGHLLGIWERGTPAVRIDEVLTRLDIGYEQRGRLDICASKGFAETAQIIAASGGIAIAAHVDREKGLLRHAVRAHVKTVLLEPALAAVEIADLPTAASIRNMIDGERELACVRSSDTTLSGHSCHVLGGIGSRRTWIKASRPDLTGLRHALEDPQLRVRLESPAVPIHPTIQSVKITGGFLDGHTFPFSADLNCLLGGTGAGKSLLLEIIRFALDQQAVGTDFPHIREEVDSRLAKALGVNATVELIIQRGEARYTIRRAFGGTRSPAPEVVDATEGAVALEDGLIGIRAFSQGEVIEYARKPVSRMALIDASLDLTEFTAEENRILGQLKKNGESINGLRAEVASIDGQLATLPQTAARLTELAGFFSDDIIQQQERWSKEKTRLGKVDQAAAMAETPTVEKPAAFKHSADNPSNQDLYARATAVYEVLHSEVDRANAILQAAYEKARTSLSTVATEWRERNAQFDARFAEHLAKIDTEGRGLPALKKSLSDLQSVKAALDDAAIRKDQVVLPTLVQALTIRDELLTELVRVRRERRDRRKARIKELNRHMAGVVRIKLEQEKDRADYHKKLVAVARGSHLRAETLQLLSEASMPIKLTRSFLDATPDLVAKATGIEEKHIEKLFDCVTDKNLVSDMLALQTIDLHDTLSVEFRKKGTAYEPIEQLAHGEKCTAILIIAMADGAEPLIIDQPEDALHAPWIEEHLVDRLRSLRGSRQYIFATRSPGLVVSADAEMIITLTSDANRGKVEASGSLERHDMNKLALYHLEGGVAPFKRRTRKLAPSVI
ncbi:AAA family ATPase [Couchioplanes caeruleus]|nr:AAA family ATPase [Couchioplanes caeruleus]